MSRELDYGITDTWDDLETTIMYGIIEDAQDDRSQLRARVNLLYKNRPVHRCLAVMIERGAKMALAQSALISELQSADHRRQRVISELLASDHKRQVQLTKTLRLLKGLQTQMVEFQRQHGPAKGPAQPDAPGEAATQYRSFVQKMAPKKRTTRLNPSATPTPVTDTHTTTSVTNAQIQEMIKEGVTAALAARDATKNSDDSHT
ncbi:hypothetical protein Tco_1125078 [Tanacetum coccineum]|uniref:Uncharacterized protein n=1 Tax=Tanacetum coccineum TaxID=301880 RepID=A0ABQ5J817_9ASTR